MGSRLISLEITVLGRAVGESIVVHFHDDTWLVVDSFRARKTAIPLHYVSHIGGDVSRILYVLATHWDHDHVAGLADVIAAAPESEFFSPLIADPGRLSSLLARDNVAARRSARGRTRHAYLSVLDQLDKRNEPGVLVSSRSLIKQDDFTTVLALSPTDWAVEDGLASARRDVADSAPPRTPLRVMWPNLTSVAVWIATPTHGALLGADLEHHARYGWDRAVKETRRVRRGMQATLVKVPHHGSEDAHSVAMWTDLLKARPEAVLTPFGWQLPRDRDVSRIVTLAPALRIAAGSHWSGWDRVAGLMRSAIPEARVHVAGVVRYVRYVARTGGWSVEEGTLRV
jgi:hypothetical protein